MVGPIAEHVCTLCMSAPWHGDNLRKARQRHGQWHGDNLRKTRQRHGQHPGWATLRGAMVGPCNEETLCRGTATTCARNACAMDTVRV